MLTHAQFQRMWEELPSEKSPLKDEICYRLEKGTIALVPARERAWGSWRNRTRTLMNPADAAAQPRYVKYKKRAAASGASTAADATTHTVSASADTTSQHGCEPGTASPARRQPCQKIREPILYETRFYLVPRCPFGRRSPCPCVCACICDVHSASCSVLMCALAQNNRSPTTLLLPSV